MNLSIMNETDSMTLSEFVEAASLFERSKEFYELLRESSEVEMLDRYIDCQEFIMTESISNPGEFGLITESTDNIDVLYENSETKKDNIFKKVGRGILKAIKAIGTFFARLATSWKNGAEVKALKAQIAEMESLNEINAQKVADHIHKLVMDKEAVINEARKWKLVAAETDAKLRALNEKFKGVDPDLYRKLKQIEIEIADDVTIEVPEMVTEIKSFTDEISNVVKVYKAMKEGDSLTKGSTKNAAHNIKQMLNKSRESRNRKTKLTINGAWIEDTLKSVTAKQSEISDLVSNLMGQFNSADIGGAMPAPNKYYSKKNKDITQKIADNADELMADLSKDVVMLLNEYVFMCGETINVLNDFNQHRQQCIRKETQVLHAIKESK